MIEISALKGIGIMEAAEAAIESAQNGKTVPMHTFSGTVEHVLAHIEEAAVHNMPEEQQRWYAIKLFERDDKVYQQIKLDKNILDHIESDIKAVEEEMGDDAESIITNERYVYIGEIIKGCYKKKSAGKLSKSDKIDRIVTNRFLGLPIFAVIMFPVYYISMVTVGTTATDWANDGLFGEGWYLFGIGRSEYSQDAEKYSNASLIVEGYEAYIEENGSAPTGDFSYFVQNEETLELIENTADQNDYAQAVNTLKEYNSEPDPADYGVWVPSIPVLVGTALDWAGAADWLSGLIIDGIIAGVGAVLGFVPQMLILFLMLAFLEACGYMARIAFVLDRVFRKFGLSGKSFIPMLIGTGCGIPGIMASRTIENERDRRMTIMTTTFIPCGAKIPFISMVAGAVFGGSAWVATSAYFIGMAAIIISGIMLKKTKMFSGDPAPFVMELPAYHLPTAGNVLRSMWERGWSFIKKAGTIILLSTIVIWFATYFGFTSDGFRMLGEEELDKSILAAIGGAIAWIFAPLGWGNWQAAVSSITGLVAKENIVGTMSIFYPNGWIEIAENFTKISGYSFLVFNLLCAPCFAAIGAIKREMNSSKWTWFAIGYQCLFVYGIALMINQFGLLLTNDLNIIGLVAAVAVLAFMIYMLFKPYKESTKLTKAVKLTQ